ncbi:hypothetical protein D9758_009827 [Tetrapyrgos nigripes]|uniref:F-box domain-containing protein n=1 Tax=Tetrapyrgos nigripes TaxID=182062 RepID=A0A8H5GMC8_9AGAR|nr:hypothetical protein D9758_009827 [Tetrapyrgos nigripes]
MTPKLPEIDSPSFPQELFDALIDYLWDSKTDLQSCALVSRSWLPKSRCHLFRLLKASFMTTNILKFHAHIRNIQSTPHLNPLVSEVSFQYASAPGLKLQSTPQLGEFLLLFFAFPSLEYLSLQGIKLIRYSLFTGLPAGFALPLPSGTTNLTTLVLCDMVLLNIEELDRILRKPCLSNLRSLSLANMRFCYSLHDTNELWSSDTWRSESVSTGRAQTTQTRLEELEIGSIKPHEDIWKYFFHPEMALNVSGLKRLVALPSCQTEILCGFLDYSECPHVQWLEMECLQSSKPFHLTRISNVLASLNRLALNYDIDSRLGSQIAINELLRDLTKLSNPRITELTVFMTGYPAQWTSMLKNLKSHTESDFHILDELLACIVRIPSIEKVRVRAPMTWFDSDTDSEASSDRSKASGREENGNRNCLGEGKGEAKEELSETVVTSGTKARLDLLFPNASNSDEGGKLKISYFDEEIIFNPENRRGFSVRNFEN